MDKTKIFLVSAGSAMLVLLGLFFPWIHSSATVLFMSASMKYNAFLLLSLFSSSYYTFIFVIFFLLILGFSIAAVAYSLMKLKNRVPKKQEGIFLMIVGGAILFLTILISAIVKSSSFGFSLSGAFGAEVKSGFGMWLTSIGAIGVGVAGFLAYQEPSHSGYSGYNHDNGSWQPPKPPNQDTGQWRPPQGIPQQSNQQPGQWQTPQGISQQPHQPQGQWQPPSQDNRSDQ